ncbi:hypothetical protein EON65_32900 [archaeon]|nr:MAG: hypothetical protein EON65_32900 [archaeon]
MHYLGWDESFDETISDPSRLAKGFTFTNRVKVWTRFSTKMPAWPCVGFLRQPVVDSEEGMNELRAEPKVYLLPCGPLNKYITPYHHGVWIHSKHLSSFSEKLEACKSEALDFKDDFAAFFLQACSHLELYATSMYGIFVLMYYVHVVR